MKKIIKAFTLIELIVWITISVLLMVSVGIFVSSWMQNIFNQQKSLENTDNFADFWFALNTSFDLINSWSFIPQITSYRIIIKRWQNFADWWFSYIWTETLSWVYCESDSEDPETNHIFIKHFIPFEEETENIFSDYDHILTASWWTDYISFQKEHKIVHKNDLDTIVIWKWIFWDKFQDWDLWTWIYLNSPTWLASSWSILFVSDTLNNRVLYYNTLNNTIHKLLDETDWLNEPTWLYYNTSEKALYIANSWNWEILKYSSKSESSAPTLTMSWFTISNVNKIEISFSGSNTFNLTNTWTWNIDNYTSDYYLTWSTNNLKYYFISKNSTSNQPTCSWNEIIFNSWKPSIYCINSWSWKTVDYLTGTISKIDIDNLSSFSNTWTYFVNLKFFDSSNNIEYENYFSYFTNWDDDLTTKADNTLEILKTWLNYPTWIFSSWSTYDFNEFWTLSYSNLTFNEKYDTLLQVPIKSLDIYDNDSLISLILKYYKTYNCYNLDEKIERTFLLKKSLK